MCVICIAFYACYVHMIAVIFLVFTHMGIQRKLAPCVHQSVNWTTTYIDTSTSIFIYYIIIVCTMFSTQIGS